MRLQLSTTEDIEDLEIAMGRSSLPVLDVLRGGDFL